MEGLSYGYCRGRVLMDWMVCASAPCMASRVLYPPTE
jgi:hypothetical protein